jgi:hypothetical protein
MTASRNSLSKHEQPSNEGVFDKNSQGGEQVKFPRHPVPAQRLIEQYYAPPPQVQREVVT